MAEKNSEKEKVIKRKIAVNFPNNKFTVDFANQDCLKSNGKSCGKKVSRDFLICEQKNPPILVGCDLNMGTFNVTIDWRLLRVPKYSFVSDENQCMLSNMAENQENTEVGQTISLALKRKVEIFKTNYGHFDNKRLF